MFRIPPVGAPGAFFTQIVYEGCPLWFPLYPYSVEAAKDSKEVPADLARAGEARHFISWRGAVAGLGGGRLNDLAVAAEAVLTDILLSAEGGVLEIESERTDDAFEVRIAHPELKDRRMRDLAGILQRFLDTYEITPTRAVLVKRLN
jgi:hypothetical protein